MKKAIDRIGFACEIAESADDALRLSQDHRFNLFILDLHLTDISGIELAKELRRLPQYLRTPTIIITGDTEDLVEAGAHVSEIDFVLQKPIHLNALESYLTQALKQ